MLAILPLFHRDRLIKAVSETKLTPVLLRFDRDGLTTGQTSVMIANEDAKFVTDCLQSLLPVLIVQRVNSELLEFHDGVGDHISDQIGHIWVEAGCQLDDSVKVLTEEI